MKKRNIKEVPQPRTPSSDYSFKLAEKYVEEYSNLFKGALVDAVYRNGTGSLLRNRNKELVALASK